MTTDINPEFFAGLDIDLSDILDDEQLEKAKRGAKLEAKAKRKLAKQEAAAEAPPKAKPSPWRATKVILVMQQTECRCGATFEHPAAKMPLAHFDHVRDPSKVWEVAKHPSTINPDLPRETRLLRETVEACPKCFNKGEE